MRLVQVLGGSFNAAPLMALVWARGRESYIAGMATLKQAVRFCITDDKVRIAYATMGRGVPSCERRTF